MHYSTPAQKQKTIMKPVLLAALLLALTTPAVASSAAIWDCGKGITAISNRGQFSIEMGKMYEGAYPDQGAVKWDFQGSKAEVRLNGKLCKRTN
jgi:hypothetical protein